MTTDDLSDVRFCDFQFSDGHAVEITTPRVASQNSTGNLFGGYSGTPGSNPTASSGSTDAAIYQNAGGAVTIDVSDGGDTPSVRNGTSATTTVNNPVTFTLTDIDPGSEVRFLDKDNGFSELTGVESSGTSFAYNYNYVSDINTAIHINKFNKAWKRLDVVLGNTNASEKAGQLPDFTARND